MNKQSVSFGENTTYIIARENKGRKPPKYQKPIKTKQNEQKETNEDQRQVTQDRDRNDKDRTAKPSGSTRETPSMTNQKDSLVGQKSCVSMGIGINQPTKENESNQEDNTIVKKITNNMEVKGKNKKRRRTRKNKLLRIATVNL